MGIAFAAWAPRLRPQRGVTRTLLPRRPCGHLRSAQKVLSQFTTAVHSPTISAEGVFEELLHTGVQVLNEPTPLSKARRTHAFFAKWQWYWRDVVSSQRDECPTLSSGARISPPETPSRPAKPPIVDTMPRAKESPFPTSVFYLHSMAHVELNAIDLAWDTMLRAHLLGPPSPPWSFYHDFLLVANDESRHFGWLSTHLTATHGVSYGALPAHRIIWDSADKTRHSLLARLAVGQLVQEARGLDAGPRLAQRLLGCGDRGGAEIVARIAREETAHVAAGVRWFVWLCGRTRGVGAGAGVDPVERFHGLALEFANTGALRPPFNEEGRREAGMGTEWYVPVSEAIEEEVRRREKRPAR